MQSTIVSKLIRWSIPCIVTLLGAAGCGGDGTTSTSTGASTSGAGGSGGGKSTTSSTGSGAGGGGGSSTSTSTGLGMDGPPVPVDAPVYNLKANATTPIKPGSQAGYGITGDGFGTFVIAWTGNTQPGNPPVTFEGSVWTTGHFSSIVLGCSDASCTLEPDDVVSPPDGAMGGGEHIGFKTTSTDDLDGFEFSTDKEPVYFELKYDGLIQTPRVVYADADNGGSPANPQKIPFGIKAP
jgi:hypothetical protein